MFQLFLRVILLIIYLAKLTIYAEAIKYRLIYMYKNHIKAKKMFNTNDFYIIELQKEN